jgi:GNAT superfamily N-acetyltransferase
LWYHRAEMVGWGWAYLPREVTRSDRTTSVVEHAYLVWQVHPDQPGILDEILDWYDGQTPRVDRRTSVRAVDDDALDRPAAHGYLVDEKAAADDAYWLQLNERDLVDLPEPLLPDGFRFRTADEVGPEAAWKAHVDAWHPSALTLRGLQGAQQTWPYRGDLHILVEAPDATLAATAIMWLDEQNKTAEFEPVGTHRDYRRRGLGTALLRYGMQQAKNSGATRMTVACLGAAGHPAAKGLYYDVGFSEFTREVPHVKRASPAPTDTT